LREAQMLGRAREAAMARHGLEDLQSVQGRKSSHEGESHQENSSRVPLCGAVTCVTIPKHTRSKIPRRLPACARLIRNRGRENPYGMSVTHGIHAQISVVTGFLPA